MSERVQITYLVGLVIVTVAMVVADCQTKTSAQDHGITTEGERKVQVQGRGDPGAD